MNFRFSGGVETRHWAPLIDGTYAIVLTLLVIELPSQVIELAKDFDVAEMGGMALVSSMLRLLGGYLAVFLVIFDIWAKKRRLLQVSEQFCRHSKLEAFEMIISLFLATLVPPLYYVLNHMFQGFAFGHHSTGAMALDKFAADVVAAIFVACGILIYLLVFLGAQRRIHSLHLRFRGLAEDSDDRNQLRSALANLRALRADALIRCLAAPVIGIAGWALSIYPPTPALVYALTGFWQVEPRQDADRR